MKLKKFPLYYYALLAMPLGFVGLPIYINLPEYYSSTFSVSLSTIGIILLCTRTIDTISDPIIGILSDKFSQYHRCLIVTSAVFLGVFFYCLFNPVFSNKVLNLIVFSFLTYIAFSLVSINHIAYLSNFENKTEISSIREIFTLIGLLCATVMPSILMLKFPESQSFFIISIIFFGAISICTILFGIYNKQIFVRKNFSNNTNRFLILKNKTFILYFLFLLFNGFAIATPSTLVLFYIKDFLLMKGYTGLFLFLYFISAIGFMPLWNIVLRKIMPMTLLKIGIIGSIITFSICCFVPGNNGNVTLVSYSVVCVLSGIFFGIDLVVPPVLTSSFIEKNNYTEDKLFIFSITHFIGKISIALISGIVLIVIGNLDGLSYIYMVHNLYTILPCVFKIIGLVFLGFIS